MPPARTTELEAVNYILRKLGRRPVNSLAASDLTPDAAFSLAALRDTNKAVQAVGWHFNRESGVRYTPDGSNKVPLADDIVRVDEAKRSGTLNLSRDIIMRVDPADSVMKLYDRAALIRNEDPFVFTEDTVYVDQVRFLDFDKTPESFRRYVMTRAGREVQAGLVSDPALYRFSLDEEGAALRLLMREETDTLGANFMHEYRTRRIVGRISPVDRMETF